MYNGKLRCPGCGRTGEEAPRQSKDCLCKECENALKIGLAVIKERNLQSKSYCIDDFKVGTIKWYTYTDDVEKALINLLNTFSQFKETSKIWGFSESLYYNKLCSSLGASHEVILPSKTFEAAKRLCEVLKKLNDDLAEKSKTYKAVLDKELAEKRNKLYEELATEKNKIYNDGVRYGRNLLVQLNNGEIAPNEILKDVKPF